MTDYNSEPFPAINRVTPDEFETRMLAVAGKYWRMRLSTVLAIRPATVSDSMDVSNKRNPWIKTHWVAVLEFMEAVPKEEWPERFHLMWPENAHPPGRRKKTAVEQPVYSSDMAQAARTELLRGMAAMEHAFTVGPDEVKRVRAMVVDGTLPEGYGG